MDIEEDDSMEIDESVPAAPIIERRSDDFNSTNNSLSEKDQTTISVDATSKTSSSDQVSDNTLVSISKEVGKNNINEKVDVVILDDDDDEPVKKAEGN